MDLKPIETIYKGYRFRSRLEARWAVFFDQLGVAWQYEPQGYCLPSGPYLPDFFLSFENFAVFVEIKNESLGSGGKVYSCVGCFWETPSTKEEHLALELAIKSEHDVCICYGDPYSLFNWDAVDLYTTNPRQTHFLEQMTQFYSDIDVLKKACLKARQYRFEHGETP